MVKPATLQLLCSRQGVAQPVPAPPGRWAAQMRPCALSGCQTPPETPSPPTLPPIVPLLPAPLHQSPQTFRPHGCPRWAVAGVPSQTLTPRAAGQKKAWQAAWRRPRCSWVNKREILHPSCHHRGLGTQTGAPGTGPGKGVRWLSLGLLSWEERLDRWLRDSGGVQTTGAE